MKNRISSIVVLAYIFTLSISASNYYFSKIDTKNSLSHNHVKALIQSSDGFMWFGTRSKLNRYDGISFKLYDCYDSKTKNGNNNISALFEDKNKHLWIGTDKGIFIFDPVQEVFTSFNKRTNDNVEITNWIADIECDLTGNIWIMVPNQGLFKYNEGLDKLTLHHVVNDFKPGKSYPQCISIEENGRVWVGSYGSGVYLYNESDDSFVQFLGDKEGNNYLKERNIFTMSHYGDYLLIGIHDGKLVKLDKRKNILYDVKPMDTNYKIIRDIAVLNEDEIWVGTQDGIYIVNEKRQSVYHAHEDNMNIHSLSDNIIEKIYKDSEGGIWIATGFGGLSYLPYNNSRFEWYFPNRDNPHMASKRIRDLVEDKHDNIWIGTEDIGIMKFNVVSGLFEKQNLHNSMILSLMMQGDKIWAGYFKDGIDIIQYPLQSVKSYSSNELGFREESINIYAICEDRDGNIWVSNGWGVCFAPKGTMKFERMEAFGLAFAYDIIEDSDGDIWVATMGNGIMRYKPSTKEIQYFTAEKNPGLSSNSINSITEDHLRQLWFATDRGGICVYNKNTGRFTNYSAKDGLPDDNTYKIVEDKNYNLWFGTNKGLVCFNPKTRLIRIYTTANGFFSNQFNYKSGLLSKNGKLYFGTMQGMVAFDPDNMKNNLFIPPVYITGLKINNKEVNPNEKDSPLTSSIIYTKSIQLKYTQSNISFDFAALSFTAPQSNKYAYKMENADEDWVYTKNNYSASYAKLPPGKYVFKVKGTNNDGVWNDNITTLQIEIMPPFWASPVAFVLYTLCFVAVSYLIIYFSLQKYRRRNKEKQKLFETQKEKELYETKVNFFIEMAHEIRTPVSLINGPIESILRDNIKDEKIKHKLEIVEKNTKYLLSLINQLLDFRKIDSDRLFLNFHRMDIMPLLNDLISRFELQITDKKSISVQNNCSRHIITDVDKEAITKIINNILSNAIKYSDKKIEIEISADENHFIVIVSNDGEHVPQKLKEKIFEPFFRGENANDISGSGIGLAMARSLAEMHNGSLSYNIRDGNNTFTLKIPLLQNNCIYNKSEYEGDQYINEYTPFLVPQRKAACILIVEDNIDMRDFIAEELSEDYLVEKASNGIEAKNILLQKHIDIVISDIMMPEMDGLELCDYIKSDNEQSHIIVILLTARNDLQSKMKGLDFGADGYVEKPFSLEYLKAIINSLQKNRKREIELFLKKPFLPMLQDGTNKADDQFMNKVIDIVNKNISDPTFGVSLLSDQMFMSRSSLHRKVKAITDTTAIDFIRIVRLQKAAQLLKEENLSLKEVCIEVGINSVSYFIKIFQERYGMTPKEFIKMKD